MGVPGLAACTTKYQVKTNTDGTIAKSSNTVEFRAKANLQQSTRATTFSAKGFGAPVKIYATGANSRLGRAGFEKDANGNIRSNQNYSAWRSHNASVVRPITIQVSTPTQPCTNTCKGNDLASIATAATNLYAALNEIGVTEKAKEWFSGNDNETGSGAVDKNSVTAGMENAKDSATLQAEIKEATMLKDALPGKIKSAKSEIESLSAKTQGLKEAADLAQGEYTQLLESIKSQTGLVNEKKASVDGCQKGYDKAVAAYNSTPDEPANIKAQAKADMERQETLLKREQAALAKAEDLLQKLQEQETELKNKADAAKDAYDKNVQTIETKEKEVKNFEKQQTQLDKEIKKQEQRLTKMQNSEDKEKQTLEADIKKYEAQLQKIGDKKPEKSKELQTKIDNMKKRQAELKETIAIRDLKATSVGGQYFQAGQIDGQNVYAIGGTKVSKATYDKLLAAAQERESLAKA